MAETLLGIILITSSAKGRSVVCRWPPAPQQTPRLARPLFNIGDDPAQYDNPWRASNMYDSSETMLKPPPQREREERDYLWQRPSAFRDRSVSFSHSASHSASGRTSPSKEGSLEYDDGAEDFPIQDDYDDCLGYTSEFLATLLSPQRSLCHQKFVLTVDDLCFLGHPVCAESGGAWRFKAEKPQAKMRGRVSRKRQFSGEGLPESPDFDPNESMSPTYPSLQQTSGLNMFHVVFVHDLPDPSSSASGNIQKYFDIIYEQVAFTLTAVLFQEQVLSNFVENECDLLGSLKEDFAARGDPFEAYMDEALAVSSIAPALKSLYESIKSRSLAHLTIHNIPLELQLPPYLDSLIQSEDDYDTADLVHQGDDSPGDNNPWGRELSFAWRLPSLAPWKSLLLLEGPDGLEWLDVYDNIRGSNVKDEDKFLAEQLIKFLEMVDVTLSLADMASLLDWDLKTQVFPIVRWLVHHRRAKVVDIVHRGLKTVFTLPIKFERPLKELSVAFRQAFPDRSIPPLPQLLASVSQSPSNHFYATIVKSKELVSVYLDVVQWLLQHDLLVTLHLRIRVFAPGELKREVRKRWKSRRRVSWRDDTDAIFSQRGRRERSSGMQEEGLLDSLDSPRWPHLSPQRLRNRSRRGSSSRVEPPILEEGIELDEELEQQMAEVAAVGVDEEGLGAEDDDDVSTIIPDPARATFKEKQWLQMMSEGKEDSVARRFDQINRYFDGKCTDDEILFRAEISRKQLREVLHHYDGYVRFILNSIVCAADQFVSQLQTFLHPS
ncbi:nitrogen permease regulator of amino acid transport activity 3-domain-containing protein [Amylostereum chailletii]|nr:nitrogen permease regulator of amino acid transport activity 3-domain-containing protein [Amylostereum chailletii]